MPEGAVHSHTISMPGVFAQSAGAAAVVPHFLPAFSRYAAYSNRLRRSNGRSRHLPYPTNRHQAFAPVNNLPSRKHLVGGNGVLTSKEVPTLLDGGTCGGDEF